MILAKQTDYGQKIRFCEKKVGNFITSKCSKNCAFHYFSKKKNFERSLLAKETPPKRILRKNETHSFSDHFCKPPETPGKCCFGGSL